jgi:hypothetical protein
MGTPFSDINELFLSGVKDYQIDKLYTASVASAEAYLLPFMIKAITKFKSCKRDLSDRNDSTKQFNQTLTDEDKTILSDLMRIEWLTKETNDILQMRLHLQDADFKTYSEAQNLKEKRELLNATRETVDKEITQYSYSNLDWSTLG